MSEYFFFNRRRGGVGKPETAAVGLRLAAAGAKLATLRVFVAAVLVAEADGTSRSPIQNFDEMFRVSVGPHFLFFRGLCYDLLPRLKNLKESNGLMNDSFVSILRKRATLKVRRR